MKGNKDIWDAIELAGSGEHLEEEMFEFISAYADGECTAKERRLVEAYLAENAGARELLADLRMQSAMLSEDLLNSPEWLRGSILSKTTDRRTFRWPFAAGIAATAAAAAAVAFVYSQQAGPDQSNDLVATNLPQPTVELPSEPILNEGPTVSTPKTVKQEQAPVAQVTAKLSDRSKPKFVQASNPAPNTEIVEEQPIVSPPVSAETEVPDPDNTYAVVEYGSGRFESKQPDVFDGDVQAVENSKPANSPAVLPDAREKLRDKVKKMNQEKLEIDDKEKSGS